LDFAPHHSRFDAGSGDSSSQFRLYSASEFRSSMLGVGARWEVPMFSKRQLIGRFDAAEILMLTAGVVLIAAILFTF